MKPNTLEITCQQKRKMHINLLQHSRKALNLMFVIFAKLSKSPNIAQLDLTTTASVPVRLGSSLAAATLPPNYTNLTN